LVFVKYIQGVAKYRILFVCWPLTVCHVLHVPHQNILNLQLNLDEFGPPCIREVIKTNTVNAKNRNIDKNPTSKVKY